MALNRVLQRKYETAYRARNHELIVARHKKWIADHRKEAILIRTRRRCKLRCIRFAIGLNDFTLPQYCPILGIKINYNLGRGSGIRDDSPSLDRVIPHLGYIPGNVFVISGRANVVKNSGSAEEHEKIARYIRSKGFHSTMEIH